MSQFISHLYSGSAYSSEEISFSNNPLTHFADVDKEMQFHKDVSHVQLSNLTQSEFDKFVLEYGDNFKTIYFFQNTQVRDLSALGKLKNVEYLLFYNLRAAKALWNMSNNLRFFCQSQDNIMVLTSIKFFSVSTNFFI